MDSNNKPSSSGFSGRILGPAKNAGKIFLASALHIPMRVGQSLKKLSQSRFWTVQFWKDFSATVRARLPKNFDDLKNLKPEELLAALSGADITKARDLLDSKVIGRYSGLAVALIAAYFLADTASLFTDSLVPEPPLVPPPRITKKMDRSKTIDAYAAITSRNIFSSKNIIPEDEAGSGGPARKTSLPLNLIGTVVLKDELKSIASIEDKSQNMIFPLRVEDTLDGKIRITKIEHLRVYFINQSSGNLEFVEIIDDISPLNVTANRPASKGTGITQVNENTVEVQKTVIEKALSNMGEVLQQARAIPNFENGVMDGFRLIQIVPNSIYSQLGIVENDIVCGVNGEPMNDAGKAFQLFNDLRTISHLELCIKRNGRKMVKNYDVR